MAVAEGTAGPSGSLSVTWSWSCAVVFYMEALLDRARQAGWAGSPTPFKGVIQGPVQIFEQQHKLSRSPSFAPETCPRERSGHPVGRSTPTSALFFGSFLLLKSAALAVLVVDAGVCSAPGSPRSR